MEPRLPALNTVVDILIDHVSAALDRGLLNVDGPVLVPSGDENIVLYDGVLAVIPEHHPKRVSIVDRVVEDVDVDRGSARGRANTDSRTIGRLHVADHVLPNRGATAPGFPKNAIHPDLGPRVVIAVPRRNLVFLDYVIEIARV